MRTDRRPLLTTNEDDTQESDFNPLIQNLGYGSVQHLQNYADDYLSQPIEQNEANRFPQYLAAIAATLSAVAAGMVIAWTSPITPQLENGEYKNISINNSEMGWIGSFVTLGAVTMCFPFGFICDLIGRKLALLLSIIPFTIGWALIICAKSLLMIYCGRFITGMAAGACCVAAPLYTSEIAQKEIRGRLGGYFQLMTTIGIFLAYLIGKYATITQYTFICAIAPFLYFVIFVFQPESPIYSIKQMQIETARYSLHRLRGSNYNIDAEMEGMKVMLQNCGHGSFLNSLKKKPTKKAFLIIVALMFFQQMSGVNAIIFYTSNIFLEAGSNLNAQTATIIVGAVQVIATFISSLLIEKLGRRLLLIMSDFMMAVSTVFLGLFFMLKNHELVSEDTLSMLGLLPITSLCIYIVMFSIGLGPIPWSLSGEIFTPEVKSVATSIAVTFNWFLAFLITKFYLQFKEEFGDDVLFYIFSLISFGGALFCYVCVPETKGKTIEEVQRDLAN